MKPVTVSNVNTGPESPPSRRRGLKHFLADGMADSRLSPPSRRRGLKRFGNSHGPAQQHVASFAEAWIETSNNGAHGKQSMTSPPSRRRGLKQPYAGERRTAWSVASFAEAWIETISSDRFPRQLMVASFAEAWIETDPMQAILGMTNSRLLRGGVD